MGRFFWLLVVFMTFGESLAESKEPTVVQRHTGAVQLSSERRFEVETGVVKDSKTYDAFVSRILKHRISKRRPLKPSNDPLLKKPAIDFSKNHLIYAIGPEGLRLPVFFKLNWSTKKHEVTAALPRPLEEHPMAYPLHVGRYVALLVPKSESYEFSTRGDVADVEIHATYRGVVGLSMNLAKLGEPASAGSPRVIRSEQEFETFVSAIPKFAISKTSPRKPSSDPLLKRPEIDWSKRAMVVAEHLPGEMRQLRLVCTKDRVIVLVKTGPTSPVSMPVDVGFYEARIIDAAEKIDFRVR